MPVMIIPKNYRNVTGIAAVSKVGSVAQFESTLERNFLSLLEFSPKAKHRPAADQNRMAGCQRSLAHPYAGRIRGIH